MPRQTLLTWPGFQSCQAAAFDFNSNSLQTLTQLTQLKSKFNINKKLKKKVLKNARFKKLKLMPTTLSC